MNSTLRPVLLVVAFAATVAGGVTALTLRGESKEAGIVENACARAAWPLIPARCLDGGRGNDVRVVADRSAARDMPEPLTIAARFSSDFE
jgi:hypothetical protein